MMENLQRSMGLLLRLVVRIEKSLKSYLLKITLMATQGCSWRKSLKMSVNRLSGKVVQAGGGVADCFLVL
jgi:hypothetical protein